VWIRRSLPAVASALADATGREFVRRRFLITRNMRDYLTLMILLENPDSRLIEF